MAGVAAAMKAGDDQEEIGLNSEGHEDGGESRANPERVLLETHESSSVLGMPGECS
jgi:hypothetical protein